MNKSILNKRNFKKIKRLYKSGLTQLEIAKIYNVSVMVIFSFMKRFNIKARSLFESNGLRINLTKKQIKNIWKLYNLGFNREEISVKLNITEWLVRKTIQGMCRGRVKSRQLRQKNNTIKLTYEQEQLILGSLLGDASLLYRRGSYDFQVGHCLKQKEYLKFKADMLSCNMYTVIKDKTSYSAGKEFFKISYHNKYELEKIYKICIKNKIKTVNKTWAEKLDAPAIAYWFMDDGSSSFYGRSGVNLNFSTLSFPENQLKFLQKRLKKFGINTSLRKHSDGYGLVIGILQNSINKFMDLVEPYIVECMKYKIKRKPNKI